MFIDIFFLKANDLAEGGDMRPGGMDQMPGLHESDQMRS